MFRYKVLASSGGRGVARIVAGAGVCVATLLLTAASAQAHSIHIETKTCAGTEEHRVIKGKLTVRPGAACVLVFDTVEGNVSVGQGARLTTVATAIKENLSSEGAGFVELVRSEIEGKVSIEATSGTGRPFLCLAGQLTSVCMVEDQFGGNVSVTNTAPDGVLIVNNLFAQDLTCTGNAFLTNNGFINTVLGQDIGQCVGL
jgi:hypothetical protein